MRALGWIFAPEPIVGLLPGLKLVFCGTPDFAVPCLQAVMDAGHEVALVLTQPVGGQHGPEVLDELRAAGRRDPGQHDAQGGAPFLGVLQQFPDRRVRVTARRGHEQPQV